MVSTCLKTRSSHALCRTVAVVTMATCGHAGLGAFGSVVWMDLPTFNPSHSTTFFLAQQQQRPLVRQPRFAARDSARPHSRISLLLLVLKRGDSQQRRAVKCVKHPPYSLPLRTHHNPRWLTAATITMTPTVTGIGRSSITTKQPLPSPSSEAESCPPSHTSTLVLLPKPLVLKKLSSSGCGSRMRSRCG